MTYFHQEEHVKAYVDMMEDQESALMLNLLKQYVPLKAKVLELGMGAGKDAVLIDQYYEGLYTDESPLFVDYCKKTYPDLAVQSLDAKDFSLPQVFDCIYSNKALIHLERDELVKSLQAQRAHLERKGTLIHTFWRGQGSQVIEGLPFVYYEIQDLKNMVEQDYVILNWAYYTELEVNDSIYLVMRKK